MAWIFGIVAVLIVIFVVGVILSAAGRAASAGHSLGVGTVLAVLVLGGIGFAGMTALTESTGWAVFGAIVGGLTALFIQQNSRIT
ncbi:hypothetical protein EBB56_00625 [Halomonas sp. YLB-10]|uniref:hypothetical protein n=1 Tax=Halomonas sp. YLB-10 TaxID=2483111 RepID=UPI000F5F2BA4|nr:hypothetical protein [Halomonas sp. YLB-10]RQW72516.1 hypothetical protein EBB56_00625 [Halomonas sp. YLB-10]